jgi:nucleotide-binding universal stress UspA family protein
MSRFRGAGAPPIEAFVPRADVRERREIVVHAPAALVLEAARAFDLFSLPLVRAIFWLRARTLGSKRAAAFPRRGLRETTLGLGWGELSSDADRNYVAGAACQPWLADVVFQPIPPERFASFSEPDRVKIAWTLEADAVEPAVTRLATETRAVATDEAARVKFRRYWRAVRPGVLMIRRLMLRALRRDAERRWRRLSIDENGSSPCVRIAPPLETERREKAMNMFHRILFATDLTPDSTPAFREAVEMASQNGAELIIVHAYQPPSLPQAEAAAPGIYDEWERDLRVQAESRMAPLVQEATRAGARARTLLLSGAPAEAIAEGARESGADLVVMGTHGRKGVSRLLVGSVASRVISTAPCPVMTVRAA